MKFSEYKKVFSPNITGRYDTTSVFAYPDLFQSLIDDMSDPFVSAGMNKIVGLDAIGFVLASAIAIKLRSGLVLARKGGKLPLKKEMLVSRTFVDYTGGGKSYELNRNLLKSGDRVLLVDDWIETGGQMRAVISMVEECEADIVGISVFGSDRNEKTEDLFVKYNLHSIGVNE